MSPNSSTSLKLGPEGGAEVQWSLVEVSQRSLGCQRQPVSTPLCLGVTRFVLLPTLLLDPWGQASSAANPDPGPTPCQPAPHGCSAGHDQGNKGKKEKRKGLGEHAGRKWCETHLATGHPGESLWASALCSGCSLRRLGPWGSGERAASPATPGRRQDPESLRSPGEVGGFVTGREGSTRGVEPGGVEPDGGGEPQGRRLPHTPSPLSAPAGSGHPHRPQETLPRAGAEKPLHPAPPWADFAGRAVPCSWERKGQEEGSGWGRASHQN